MLVRGFVRCANDILMSCSERIADMKDAPLTRTWRVQILALLLGVRMVF